MSDAARGTPTPAISVLMPVYNAERYLIQAVDSILNQTFTDFEFLIIDDGSTDGSRVILERYAAADPRIRLVSRPNTGYAVALNEMIGMARGEFLARMDSDDVARPDRFEHQAAFLKSHPEVVCVGGWIQLIDAAGRRLTRQQTPTDNESLQNLALQGGMPMGHPTLMYRRQAVEAIGRYRTDFMPAEDVDLILRIGEQGQLAALPRVVLDYRLHSQSVSEQRVHRQSNLARTASDEACDRRGLERRYKPSTLWRPDGSRESRHKFALQYGWWAFNSGEWRTALHYGLKAASVKPWRIPGWKLAAIALLRRPQGARPSTLDQPL
jgi:glycosyltransferase involved in cell wall biosynthesis